MVGEQQILSARQVCQNCLMADHSGLPRWRMGQLGCGIATKKNTSRQATVYRCQMGFNVIKVG